MRTLLILILAIIYCNSYSQSSHSLFFDGTDDIAEIDSVSILQAGNSSVSVVLWVKVLSLPSNINFPTVLWSNRGALLTNNASYYALSVVSNGLIGIKYSDGTNTVIYESDSPLFDDTLWHNIILTIPADRGIPYLSFDGQWQTVIKTQAAGTSDPASITDGDKFFMGGVILSSQNFLHGNIYGLSVWNRELTTQEADYLSECTPIGNENGLVAFWDFNEGVGLSTTDISQNSIGATLLNGVIWSDDIPVLNCPTGIIESKNKHSLIANISPNPISDNVSFEYELQQPSDVTLQLTDISGKVIRTFFTEHRSIGKQKETLQLHDVPAGSYLLLLQAGESKTSVRVVKP